MQKIHDEQNVTILNKDKSGLYPPPKKKKDRKWYLSPVDGAAPSGSGLVMSPGLFPSELGQGILGRGWGELGGSWGGWRAKRKLKSSLSSLLQKTRTG